MAKLFFSRIFIVVLLCSLSQSSFGQLPDNIDQFLQAIKTYSVKDFCSKAKVIDNKFSIRSARGILCKDRLIAAYAEEVCPAQSSDYLQSACHQNALIALQHKSPVTVMIDYLSQATDEVAVTICRAFVGTLTLGAIPEKVHNFCRNFLVRKS